MALYLISYDIAEKDAFEYQPLWDKLEEMGATRILYSEWLVAGRVGRGDEVWSKVAPLTSVEDKLLIQEVTKDAHWDKLLISDATFQELLLEARV